MNYELTINSISKTFNLSDISKLEKQFDLYNLWKYGDKKRNIRHAKSIIKAKTAFGKSTIGLLALAENQLKGRKGIIIVPTKALKNDWSVLCDKWQLNVDIYVINTAIKKMPTIKADLVVYDEIHLFGRGAKWKQIFSLNIPYQLGLTATLPEDDELYFYLLSKLPVIADVGWDEVLDKNYICDFQIYKYPIFISPSEAYRLDKWRTDFWKYVNIVGNFSLATKVLSDADVRKSIAYRKNITESQVFGAAKAVVSITSKRAAYFYNHEAKLNRCLDIVKHFKENNIITFNQRNSFVDDLTKHMGNEAASYHSTNTDKFNNWVLKSFKHHKGKVRIINTAMALNQGVDLPKIDVAIFNSWTSSATSMNQRLGRAVRISKNKSIARIFINPLFRRDGKLTQDERWLEKAMIDVPTNKVKIINELTNEI